jgi:chemotaxis protein MotB
MRRRRTGRQSLAHTGVGATHGSGSLRWMVSYADFITLLFGFFVVLYAMSSVNEGKYRVITESLAQAFREAPTRLLPIDLGGGFPQDPTLAALVAAERSPLELPVPAELPGDASPSFEPTERPAREAAPPLERRSPLEALSGLVAAQGGNVRETPRGVEVELDASLLFASGSATLEPAAITLIEGLARELEPYPGRIEVEGHTDDRPIHSPIFPSNWELSGARAAAVVKAMLGEDLSPARFGAIGYGEFRPVADNATEEGRARNRRVVIRLREGAEEALPAAVAAGATGMGGLERETTWPAPEGLRL